MTDRELLELAAKAMGITISWERRHGKITARQQSHGYCGIFDPLHDSYDNFRLMVACRISIDQSHKAWVDVHWTHGLTPRSLGVACKDDTREAATRRAIVRAAAEIGKAMP